MLVRPCFWSRVWGAEPVGFSGPVGCAQFPRCLVVGLFFWGAAHRLGGSPEKESQPASKLPPLPQSGGQKWSRSQGFGMAAGGDDATLQASAR